MVSSKVGEAVLVANKEWGQLPKTVRNHEYMYLSNIKPNYSETHYAGVNPHGELGYCDFNDSLIKIGNQLYTQGIGAHAPSIIKYNLNNQYGILDIGAGINNSAIDYSKGICDFYVYADKKLAGIIPNVNKFESPRITCNIDYCDELTLMIRTKNPLHCHTVWLDPQVFHSRNEWTISCYGTHKYENINIPEHHTYGVVFVITEYYVEYFINLYYSMIKYFNYTCMAFCVDLSDENIERISAIPVHIIKSSKICETTMSSAKFLALEAYKISNCDYYIYMDSDMLVVDDISSMLDLIPSYTQDHVSICRQTDVDKNFTFKDALVSQSNGSYRDYDLNIRSFCEDISFAHALNSGFYIMGREAMCKANSILNRMLPNAYLWERENLQDCWWREEAILTMCISRMHNVNILPATYNVQLQAQDVNIQNGKFYFGDQSCKILHMVDESKKTKYAKILEEVKQSQPPTTEVVGAQSGKNHEYN